MTERTRTNAILHLRKGYWFHFVIDALLVIAFFVVFCPKGWNPKLVGHFYSLLGIAIPILLHTLIILVLFIRSFLKSTISGILMVLLHLIALIILTVIMFSAAFFAIMPNSPL